MDSRETSHDWVAALAAWSRFVEEHPELGYRPGKWQFHNFLRLHKAALVDCDAIRLAKRRFWVAHLSRFIAAAFDAATGFPPSVSAEPRSEPGARHHFLSATTTSGVTA
jgi:hypothetical protein